MIDVSYSSLLPSFIWDLFIIFKDIKPYQNCANFGDIFLILNKEVSNHVFIPFYVHQWNSKLYLISIEIVQFLHHPNFLISIFL